MAGDDDRDIGREIIRLLRGPVLTTDRAARNWFEQFGKHLAFAAARAMTAHAANGRLKCGLRQVWGDISIVFGRDIQRCLILAGHAVDNSVQ